MSSVKSYCSLISAILIQLQMGSIFAWGNLSFYMTSYWYHNYSKDTTNNDAFFLIPLNLIAAALTIGVGGYLEKKTGNCRLAVFLATTMTSLTYLGIYFFPNIYMVHFMAFFFGLGIGFGTMEPVKNAWLYFPQHKGKINGIIMFGFGISSAIYNYIADSYMNPEGIEPTIIVGDNKFYDEATSSRFVDCILLLFWLCLGLQIVANLLMFPAEREETLIEDTSTVSYTDSLDKNFVLICVSGFGTGILPFILVSVNKLFGEDLELKSSVVTLTMVLFGFSNGISRIIWGALGDKLPYKYIIMALNGIELVVSSLFYQYGEHDWVFVFFNVLGAACLGGIFVLYSGMIERVYGKEVVSELYSIVYFGFSISSIMAGAIATFLMKEMSDYLIVFVVSGACSVLSTIALLFIQEKKNLDSTEDVKL